MGVLLSVACGHCVFLPQSDNLDIFHKCNGKKLRMGSMCIMSIITVTSQRSEPEAPTVHIKNAAASFRDYQKSDYAPKRLLIAGVSEEIYL